MGEKTIGRQMRAPFNEEIGRMCNIFRFNEKGNLDVETVKSHFPLSTLTEVISIQLTMTCIANHIFHERKHKINYPSAKWQ